MNLDDVAQLDRTLSSRMCFCAAMAKATREPFGVMDFNSRRSPVLGTRGMVACSQPLAAEVGRLTLQISMLQHADVMSDYM